MPPLDGVLVADLSRVLAGPLCAMVLADLGADVVKVERPDGGDDTRGWGPTYFLGLNRGKRSVALDLKDSTDRALAFELCARADVVLESFRPGTADRLGLGFDAVRAVNARVVYASVSAFGAGEAARDLPGYDLLLQAMSGLMSVTGEPGGPPLKVGTALIDMVCGLFTATAVCAALREGAGRRVEVSLMDSALAALLNQASSYLNGPADAPPPTRLGNRHPSIAPYETVRAADGDLALAVGNDAQFARLCEVLGAPRLAERWPTNDDRVAARDALAAELAPRFAAAPIAVWCDQLRAAGVPAGPVHDVAQAFAAAEALGLDPVLELDGVRTVRSPVLLDGAPAQAGRRPPRLGEHDADVRAWLAAPRPAR
jgi:crotonobetainyl-CoA:carnitine CoA-transferase CaiB-like acyl-CoA transferase